MKEIEKSTIRELAKRLDELANLPVMEERRKLWYAHNDLQTDQPVIDCSPEGAWMECVPPETLVCESAELRAIEWELRARIHRAEVINDDVPAERLWHCGKLITETQWGLDGKAVEIPFSNVIPMVPSISQIPQIWMPGFAFHGEAAEFAPVITEEDMEDPDIAERITPPDVIYDEAGSKEKLALHQELLGDILDVRWTGNTFPNCCWGQTYAFLRGYENMLTDFYDYPDEMHAIMDKMLEGFRALYRKEQEMGLLDLNTSSQYCGSGGYGYTHDLPVPAEGEKVDFQHIWGFAESQEYVCVGPEETREFAIAYEREFLKDFGLSAYGCCDNLEQKLDDVFTIPNIRRISVSPWANVASMRDQIGMKAIFSCKPNPSLITNGWDEDAQRKYITQLLTDGKGTPFEIILKDTHTMNGHPENFRKWTDMCRECITNVYG